MWTRALSTYLVLELPFTDRGWVNGKRDAEVCEYGLPGDKVGCVATDWLNKSMFLSHLQEKGQFALRLAK